MCPRPPPDRPAQAAVRALSKNSGGHVLPPLLAAASIRLLGENIKMAPQRANEYARRVGVGGDLTSRQASVAGKGRGEIAHGDAKIG